MFHCLNVMHWPWADVQEKICPYFKPCYKESSFFLALRRFGRCVKFRSRYSEETLQLFHILVNFSNVDLQPIFRVEVALTLVTLVSDFIRTGFFQVHLNHRFFLETPVSC